MENAKERLIKFLAFKGLGQTKFERLCGLSNGYINNLKANPGQKSLQKIVGAFPDLSPVWLLTGDGPMILPASGIIVNSNVKNSGNFNAGSGVLSVGDLSSVAILEKENEMLRAQVSSLLADKKILQDQLDAANEKISKLIDKLSV